MPHDAAPWEAVFVDHGGYDSMTDALYVKASGRILAVLDLSDYGQEYAGNDYDRARAEAVARVMAAAPELLESLKWALSLIDDQGYRDDVPAIPIGHAKALAVVAKAEGA